MKKLPRYSDSYVKEVAKAAKDLAKRRLLLPADVQRYVVDESPGEQRASGALQRRTTTHLDAVCDECPILRRVERFSMERPRSSATGCDRCWAALRHWRTVGTNPRRLARSRYFACAYRALAGVDLVAHWS